MPSDGHTPGVHGDAWPLRPHKPARSLGAPAISGHQVRHHHGRRPGLATRHSPNSERTHAQQQSMHTPAGGCIALHASTFSRRMFTHTHVQAGRRWISQARQSSACDRDRPTWPYTQCTKQVPPPASASRMKDVAAPQRAGTGGGGAAHRDGVGRERDNREPRRQLSRPAQRPAGLTGRPQFHQVHVGQVQHVAQVVVRQSGGTREGRVHADADLRVAVRQHGQGFASGSGGESKAPPLEPAMRQRRAPTEAHIHALLSHSLE